jgi:endonuclease/exonuclease/phosphatase family metal-dependent hydrolase
MNKKITRRTALKTMAAVGASFTIPFPSFGQVRSIKKEIKLGVIADLHGGLASDAAARLNAFLDEMKQHPCDALVQMGDFAFPNDAHQEYPDAFNAAHKDTLHVIGNHEFDFGLTREDCYKAWGITASFYRRDIGDLRILVLDGNDKGSPTHRGGYPSYIGDRQKKWLATELEKSEKPLLILCHQPLAGTAAIDNAADIQQLFSKYKSKIMLCMNGHSHVDSLVQIEGVPYLHINSASYYWVGGQTRMAYYTEPLYSVVTINPETATVTISGKAAEWKEKSPKELGYFDRDSAPPESIVTPQIRPHHISKSELTVMTWNIWGRLNREPRYAIDEITARQRTIDIIRDSGVDIVAMIETYGSAAEIAASLGFHFHTAGPDDNLCIFSRYPLSDVELLSGLNPFSFIAATVTLPGGQTVRLYDIWLTSGGRHIVEIKNKAVSDEAFSDGDDRRFDHLQELLKHPDFKKHYANADAVPVIVAGDFNCVSHLDYTQATRDRGINQSRILAIKASKAMAELGFVDTYRAANPGIAKDTLGYTWTTVGQEFIYDSEKGFVPTANNPEPEYRDPYTRIDYIYAHGPALKTVDSQVIRHHSSQSKRSFPEFPSDHAAVVTTFRVSTAR